MAANFCANWLQKNKEENEELLRGQQTEARVGDGAAAITPSKKPSNPNEITFENNEFRLIVKTAPVKRARKFKLEDQQFTLLILPKTQRNDPPLIDILNFLEAGFNHILKEIKAFVNVNEHRIAYLTLYQEPMVY